MNAEKISKALYKLQIPPVEAPFSLRTFWFHFVNADDAAARTGISTGLHCHSFFECHFPQSGEAVYRMESGEEIPLSPPCFLLFSPREHHEVLRISPDYRKFSFGFSIEGTEENALARRCHEALSHSAVTVARQTEETDRIFSSALFEAENPTALTPFRVRDLTFALLSELLRISGATLGEAETASQERDPRVERACRFWLDNLEKSPTVEEVAANVSLSSKQLHRLMRAELGLSPRAWLQKERSALAKEALKRTDLSLERIAEKLGYSNEYNFNRAFRAAEGMSPGVFRRSTGKK